MPRGKKKLAYVPYTPISEAYREMDRLNVETSVLQTFEALFGCGQGALPAEFKRFLSKTLEDHHPHLRCSSLRAVLEGRVPGVPKPLLDLPIDIRGNANFIMMFMDVMETMVAEYIEYEMTLADQAKRGIPPGGHKRKA